MFAVLFAALVGMLPPGRYLKVDGGSVVGGLLHRNDGNMWFARVAVVVRGERAGTLLHLDYDSADEFARLMMAQPNDIVEFSVGAGLKESGFLFTTHETEFVRIAPMRDIPVSLSIAEQELVRSTVSHWAETEYRLTLGNPRAVADFLVGDVSRSRMIWSGYGMNTALLAALVLWLHSFRWIPDWFRGLSHARRDRRRAKGLCGTCRYDLRGDMSGVCPECGNRNVPGS